MAANGANDAAVRGFLHQLLHSIVRQIESNDGRGDNAVIQVKHGRDINLKQSGFF